MFGPYHRLESPTQTSTDAGMQQTTMELWGKAARHGSIPAVKAYRNSLASGTRGIQFESHAAPDPSSSTPLQVFWYYPSTSGTAQKVDAFGTDFAVISLSYFLNAQP